MDAKIKEVAKERGDAEVERMKVVTKKAMQESSELYGYLLKEVQPAIGQLVNKGIELNERNKIRQMLVDSFQEFTDRVQRKNKRQIQVGFMSEVRHQATQWTLFML
jgi:hypothetical protein